MNTTELVSFTLIATQIITESMPISSSAHVTIALLLFSHFGIKTKILSVYPPFVDDFLHGPASLITLIFFRKRWWFLVKNFIHVLFKLPYSSILRYTIPLVLSILQNKMYRRMRDGTQDERSLNKKIIKLEKNLRCSQRRAFDIGIRLIMLFCISSSAFLFFYAIANHDNKILAIDSNHLQVLFIGLSTTVIMLLSLAWNKKRTNFQVLTWQKALILGATQGLALFIPGLSRMGSTITVALWLGMSPRRSFEWSFAMVLPYILAAFALKGLPSMIKNANQWFSIPHLVLYIIATIFSYLCFAWSYKICQRNQLWWLGTYMFFPLIFIALKIAGF